MSRTPARALVAAAVAGAAFLATTVSAAAPTVVSTGDISVGIPDRPGAPALPIVLPIPLTVTETKAIKDVNVYVRADHTATGDLTMELKGPDGTKVTLVDRRGGTGDDFGSGAADCTGTPTGFDDQAATAIAAAVPPFDALASYKPEQPLSAFVGKPANGQWTLELTDTATGEVGTVYCFELELEFSNSELEVKQPTATPNPAVVGGEVTYVTNVKNNGTDTSPPSTLTFTVPTGMTVTSLTSVRPADVDKCQTTTPVKCDLAGIGGGAEIVVTLLLTADEAGSKKVVAKLTPSDSAPPNEEKDVTIEVLADATGGFEVIRVSTLGLGRGTVTSAPAAITCGQVCQANFIKGAKITLSAEPASDSVFAGWGGACDGTPADADCEVTADGVKDVTATFDKAAGGNGGNGGNGGGGNAGGGGGGKTYDICTITGTNKADKLRGTKKADVICGFGGNDRIYGGKGNDKLYGGKGKDKLYGGKGVDSAKPGKGDKLYSVERSL